MQQPLPSPTLDTFLGVTECLLAQLHHGVPAYHIVAQLHEAVLPKLHKKLGTWPETAPVYEIAMLAFNKADSITQERHEACSIQLVLLMAQNGMEGLTSQGCECLVEAITDYNKSWVQETFRQEFISDVKGIFLGDKVLKSGADVLPFVTLEVPALCSRQLPSQLAYMDFAEGDMPDYMVPTDAWPTCKTRHIT